MPSVIIKAGYNRNTSQAILYSTKDYIRWKWLQGEGQTTDFLKYWRTEGQICSALRSAIAWYQHNTGVGFPLFERPKITVTYSDLRMLPSLGSFLATINASFQLDTNYVVPTQRDGDRHIMDIARESNLFQEADLAPLNYCRLYMEATTISDITSPDGINPAPNLSFGVTALPSKDRHHRAHQNCPHKPCSGRTGCASFASSLTVEQTQTTP
jgi:hypothetical protein